MNKNLIPIKDCQGSVNIKRIEFVENEIGIKFPQSFVDLVKNCDGGIPEISDFSYYDKDLKNYLDKKIDRFLSLNESQYSILREFKNPLPFFPKGLVVFAYSDALNFICFDYRYNKLTSDPSIVYWKFEENLDEIVSPLARNFELFLWKIKEHENKCDSSNTVDQKRIDFIEDEIGINLPKFFVNYIKNSDGESPVKSSFRYFDVSYQGYLESGIGVFLTLNKSKFSLLMTHKDPPEFFPEGLIAFAEDGGGDFICFDYREGKNIADPPIVYWSHEADIGKDISFVANNFEEFMGMLEEPSDYK